MTKTPDTYTPDTIKALIDDLYRTNDIFKAMLMNLYGERRNLPPAYNECRVFIVGTLLTRYYDHMRSEEMPPYVKLKQMFIDALDAHCVAAYWHEEEANEDKS